MRDEVLGLERAGWAALSAGTAVRFSADLMTDDALFVVPGTVLDRDEVLAWWEGVPPWRDSTIADERLLDLDATSTLLTYAATATRADGSTSSARFTSRYVHRDDRTRLAFHQQTPAPAP